MMMPASMEMTRNSSLASGSPTTRGSTNSGKTRPTANPKPIIAVKATDLFDKYDRSLFIAVQPASTLTGFLR